MMGTFGKVTTAFLILHIIGFGVFMAVVGHYGQCDNYKKKTSICSYQPAAGIWEFALIPMAVSWILQAVDPMDDAAALSVTP